MHSQSHRWTTISAIIAFTFIAPGCRGSKPFGRFVKVTQGAEADLPHVDPPQQRLATSSRPRGTSEISRGGTEVSMTAEPIGQNSSEIQSARSSQPSNRSDFAANRQPTVSDRSASRSDRKTLQQDILRRDDSSRDVSRNDPFAAKVNSKRTENGKRPSPQVERLASQRKETTPRTKAPGDAVEAQPVVEAQHSDLLDAFADYPPEVQREALRRLVAATSKSAKKTDQPTGFDTELQKQAQHLPELPPARNSAADVPATRLGTKPRRSSSVVTVADKSRPHEKKPVVEPAPQAPSGRDLLAQQQKAAQQKIAAMTSRVSHLAAGALDPSQPTDLEMPLSNPMGLANDPAATAGDLSIASVGDLETDPSKGSVQPASAIRPDGAADDMVARAISEDRAVSEDSAVPESNLPQPKSGMVPSDIDSLTDEQLYRALVKQLSTASDGESDAQRSSRLIKLRHLMVLSGDVDSAVKKIEGMSESEQEFLRHQLLGLWTMVDPSGHPVASRRITTALPQLRQATQFAAAATDSLEVRSVSFCSEIESYGQIKPFKSNRFDTGQQVILYCEIENFSAKKGDDGYVTEMQGSYDIFDANNQKVVSQLLPADRQVSSNYLRDYYIAYQMHLPKQLPAGEYRLQLTMEDVGGKKYGQSSIDLEIGK